MIHFKASIIYMLAAVGLDNIARQAKWTAGIELRRAKRAISARMLWQWKPLVPEDDFTACARNAIQTLKRLSPDQSFGDYLEFGVSRGTSLACMFHALEKEGLSNLRLIGFDSFEGLPPEAAEAGDKNWEPGAYKSTLTATRRYLQSKNVDERRVTLIKGWFKDTLTPTTKETHNIDKASLIMIDCDIYSASRDALLFSASAIKDHAVIFFDDWGWRSDIGEIGQKEAFEEFLTAFPQLRAEPLPAYLPQARVFLVTRQS